MRILPISSMLIEVPDADLFGWATGASAVPANYDTPVFRADAGVQPGSPHGCKTH
jgi:succinate dehydrogenase flavin-adding protein (antitoxin of CptAB toxin-antitoxin module)